MRRTFSSENTRILGAVGRMTYKFTLKVNPRRILRGKQKDFRRVVEGGISIRNRDGGVRVWVGCWDLLRYVEGI